MFGKVLIPLDGSDIAECSLDYLSALNVKEVLLVRVSDFALRTAYPGESNIPSEILENERTACCQYLELVSKTIPGLPIQWEYAVGDPAERILNLAEKTGSQLILMTSHGRTGFKRFLIGSVAEHVARHASCPVMIVGRKSIQTAGQTAPSEAALV